MKRISLIILVCFISHCFVIAQDSDIYSLFVRFARLYDSGDLLVAEKCMLQALKSKESISEDYLVAAYNNLGATNTLLGKYNKALEYYDLAESSITEKVQFRQSLADICINKALICTYQKSYSRAVDYLEKGLRIYHLLKPQDKDLYQRISTAYLNIGIAFYHLKDYPTALKYLKKSADLKFRFNLSRIAIVYQNIARVYVKTGDSVEAEKFYIKSIDSFNSEFGENYFRTVELYLDYGLFLESERRAREALYIFNKALAICLKDYGEKSTFAALSYKYMGDYFISTNDYDSSLIYYQKALISVESDFNDTDPGSNPSLKASSYGIRLLEILKGKAKAFELRAMQEDNHERKLGDMKKSLETIELALKLIHSIRDDYMNEESRIYLADNEKETFVFAADISHYLYRLTGDPAYIRKMYDITKEAKAAVLLEEIKDNELYYSHYIPDTLQKKHTDLLLNIGAFSNLIQEEKRKPDPDEEKLDLWSDNLFENKLANEKLEAEINKQFPVYRELIQKTGPASIEEIQDNLKRNETLVEYFLSDKYDSGKRKLYIFLVTRNKLEFVETGVDSLFKKDVATIRQGTAERGNNHYHSGNFREYTTALYNMYNELIRPVEYMFHGRNLIIVPDEEIAFLPFEAFLKSRPDSSQTNFEGLQYLISRYIFSYGYTSSLIFRKTSDRTERARIYAFSSDYPGSPVTTAGSPGYLAGATREIKSISRWFPCEAFFGEHATESNFKSAILNNGVLHLAMHSKEDPENSRYSCLLFDTKDDTLEDGKLFNYEISLCRINSPMVVLSSCNTGTGTLYRGEGIMSLARGFILAGSSSVIITFWNVNDEASAAVMSGFYHHLSEGKSKGESMRMTKLEYMKSQPPMYSNPYYWAGYEVLGDNSPIVRNIGIFVLPVCAFVIFSAGVLLIYFRWRRIVSALSL